MLCIFPSFGIFMSRLPYSCNQRPVFILSILRICQRIRKYRNNYTKINYFLYFTCSFDMSVNMDVSFTDWLEDTGRCGNSAFEF